MANEKKSKECKLQNIPRAGILAHVEHFKTVGEALAQAGETYKAKHDASEKEDRFLKDLPCNLLETAKGLHASLIEVPKKTFNAYCTTVKGEGC